MANVLFKRIQNSELIDDYPIVDGSFYITKDGKSYADFDDERVPFGGTPDATMSDVSTNTVQNKVIKEYVDDVHDELSALKYNLITDGPEVKTGYQIDGKDVYAKRFSMTFGAQDSHISHGVTNFILDNHTEKAYLNGVWRNPNIEIGTEYIYYYASGTNKGSGYVTMYYTYAD